MARRSSFAIYWGNDVLGINGGFYDSIVFTNIYSNIVTIWYNNQTCKDKRLNMSSKFNRIEAAHNRNNNPCKETQDELARVKIALMKIIEEHKRKDQKHGRNN